MKMTLIILICFLQQLSLTDSGIYNIQFQDINLTTINMASYKGKKIFVVEFNAANPERGYLLSLDSLYRNNLTRLQVIAVPIDDFGTPLSAQQLQSLLRDSLRLNYPIAGISKGKKIDGAGQHILLQWLTHKASNSHFDDEIIGPGETYVISETGVLLGLVKKKMFAIDQRWQTILAQQVN